MAAMIRGGGWKGIVNKHIPDVLDRMNGAGTSALIEKMAGSRDS